MVSPSLTPRDRPRLDPISAPNGVKSLMHLSAALFSRNTSGIFWKVLVQIPDLDKLCLYTREDTTENIPECEIAFFESLVYRANCDSQGPNES